MNFEINWLAVANNLLEGATQGTGFIGAILFWVSVTDYIGKRRESRKA
jgi:hypothetical protein